MIVFDGVSEDVPNEDLTLIKGDLSLSFSLCQSFPVFSYSLDQ